MCDNKEPCEWCMGYGEMCGFDFYIEHIEQQMCTYPIISMLETTNYCPNCGRKLTQMPEVEK